MQKIFFEILILLTLISCGQNEAVSELKYSDTIESELSDPSEIIDTILEIANPTDLDLDIHQLYIDTTKKHYTNKSISSRRSQEYETTIKDHIHYWNKDFSFQEIETKDFPKVWRIIRRLGDRFYLYDRCDGADPTLELYKNVLVYHEVHEKRFQIIEDVINVNNKEVELNISQYANQSEDSNAIVHISPVDSFEGIFLFRLSSDNLEREQYITPIEKINTFDVIVNHCPINKVSEFDKFDNSAWSIRK